MTVVTREELKIAIYHNKLLIDSLRQDDESDEDVAKRTSIKVTDLFGFNTCIADNGIESKNRDVLYTLLEHGLINTPEMEKVIPYNTKGNWRVHYWEYDIKRIKHVSKEKITELSIYDDPELNKKWENALTVKN